MKKVTLGFGRMNPSTTGHELVANSIARAAKSRGAVARLYLSHTTNPKKDPLSYDDKIKFAKLAFSKMLDVVKSRSRTIIEVMVELEKENFTDVTVVVGSDRVQEFKTLLNRYNGKDFTFDSVEVISAGERDPDAEGVSGMSASKMRGFVRDNDFDKFKDGVPSALSNAQIKQMFNAIKRGMKLTESVDECWDTHKQVGMKKKGNRMVPNCVPKNEEDNNEALSMAQRRKRGMMVRRIKAKLKRTRELASRRFASQPKLKIRARRAALKFLKRRFGGGKAYASLSTGQKIAIDKKVEKMKGVVSKISARLLPRVRKAEIDRKKSQALAKQKNENFENFFEDKVSQDKDIADKPGSQPAKYFKGMDKSTKDSRDAHFKSKNLKPDDDKSAYVDAPGDAEAREKNMQQSKHTKKFKQMFGEDMDKRQVSKLEQLVRMGLADKKLLAIIKRSISKMNAGEILNPTERNATQDLLSTLLDMVTSSDQLFRLTRTQLQKEEVNEVFEDVFGLGKALSPITHAKSYGMAKDALKGVLARKKDAGKDKLYYASQVARSYVGVDAKKLANMTEMDDEDEDDDYDDIELDGLVMAQIEVSNLLQDAEELLDILDGMEEEPESWVSSKITKATDYIQSVKDYLEFEGMYDDEEDEDDDENEIDDDDIYEAIVSIPKEELNEEELQEFSDLFEKIEGLKNKSEKSGISYGILKQVYNRGMAAWKGGHRPGTTPQQWAFARVNSFITKGSGTWGGADSDLASKVKGSSSKKEETESNPRIPRKPGQPANSDKHSDLYTDENPKDTIHGLKFATKEDAEASIKKIKSSGRSHAHKVQAAVAMEQRAKEMNKTEPASVYRSFINSMKNKNEAFEKFSEALEYGTDKARKKYASDTPGQSEEACCDNCEDDELVEAEYQGKTVKLNDPFRTPDGPKKFGVYTMGPNGNVVVVRFGDPNMEIKRDDPARRASFRARHGCDEPGPKYKAKYWSCYQWRAGSKVDS